MIKYNEKDKYFLKKMINYKMLHLEEERQLSKRWQLYRDEKALHDLVQCYFKLVIAQAFKYRKYGLPIADLIQEGVIGLMTAGKKFDPTTYNVRFSTYSRWWIKSYMQDYILKNWSIVRIQNNNTKNKLFLNYNHNKNKIHHVAPYTHLQDTSTQIIGQLNNLMGSLKNIKTSIAYTDFSLSTPINDVALDTFETLIEDDSPSPEEMCHQSEVLERQIVFIQKILTYLTDDERLIIEKKYLSHNYNRECIVNKKGQKLNQVHIKNLESKAFRKMKHAIIHNKDLNSKDLY